MAVDPGLRADEQRESLEAERDFLLRSLDDLDANRAAGDIDDETYERLHADYTARAAAVIRSLRDGVDSRPEPAPTSNRRRFAIIGVLVVFAVLASVVLAAALGARLPGQTVTGNSQSAGTGTQEANFRRAVERRPDDPQSHLAYARFLLGSNKPAAALKEYDATTRLDPKSAEAYAYGGWIVYLAGLPDDALKRLDAAVAADPAYSDAHFFRGMVLFQGKNDPCHAKTEFQLYLAPGNQTPMRSQVEQVLASAVTACPSK